MSRRGNNMGGPQADNHTGTGNRVAAPFFVPPSLPLCVIGLALSVFMQVLDTTIANVSLPTIAGNLGASSQQATWVITSFAVSLAIALPLTGWLGRRFGETRLFVWATLAFALMSLLCGLAQSMGMLVLARALQGFVAGPMYPVAQSLLVSIYPREKRGQALALLGMITVVAPIVGPILGGWLTDNYSWEWIFLINVPLGIFSAWVVGRQLKDRPEQTEKPKMDYVGLVTLVIGVGALQLLLDLGNDEDWFASNLILALACVAAVSLLVFAIWELTDAAPIVNLRLFARRNFCVGTLALTLGFAAFFSVALLIPLWLQRDMGYNAVWAGLAAAPLGILPLVLAPVVSQYAAPRFDLRGLASMAFVFLSLTCFMRAGFNLHVDFARVAMAQFIMGVGVALFFMPVLQMLLSDLDAREIAAGSGLATFLRTLGSSFAASLTTWLWARRTQQHHANLTESISDYRPGTLDQLQQIGQGDVQRGAMMLDRMIDQQASQLAFNDVFYLLGWLFLALIALLWWARPPFGGGAGSGDGAGAVGQH